MPAQVNDRRHLQEVETMNTIIGMLKQYDFAAQDRILTWVQMKIELDWDD